MVAFEVLRAGTLPFATGLDRPCVAGARPRCGTTLCRPCAGGRRGWTLGCTCGFGVALAIDRALFLQRGLLPLASLTSTPCPLVAVAPIAVMWFGFEWPSKAAVVVLMTFFPMLVSTLAGLQAAGKLERELMHSYAAKLQPHLVGTLRLPAATPHLFGALKVNASLAFDRGHRGGVFDPPRWGWGFDFHRSGPA